MAVVGIRGGNRPGGFLLNSWGTNFHSGPLGPGNPSPAGFWCEAAVLNRMLAEGDSWAFSNAVGFPARKLDWYAMRRPVGRVEAKRPDVVFLPLPFEGRGPGVR